MTSDTSGINVHGFTDLDHTADLAPFIATLEVFDAIPQLQELKALARKHVRPGDAVLDVGCGFGIESFKLAPLVEPGGKVTGIDKSAVLIDKARERAAHAKAIIDFQLGDAEALPFQDNTFDVARVERVLVYLPDPKQTLSEMRRVTRSGGTISMIEPDFGTNEINFPDRALMRRIVDQECDVNVPQGLLMRDMPGLLEGLGWTDIGVDTRIVIFPLDLAVSYFTQMGKNAKTAGVISESELETWTAGIKDLQKSGKLFSGIGYYLFTAKA